jgi:hypothetical protein
VVTSITRIHLLLISSWTKLIYYCRSQTFELVTYFQIICLLFSIPILTCILLKRQQHNLLLSVFISRKTSRLADVSHVSKLVFMDLPNRTFYRNVEKQLWQNITLLFNFSDRKTVRQMITYMFNLNAVLADWLISRVPHCKNTSIFTESKAFSKPINSCCTVSLQSNFVSGIWQIQKILSLVDLLRRNPQCWSPIISSMYGLNLQRRILNKMLIPRQLQ